MTSQHHELRELDAGLCSALRSFNTTYNGEKDVPPYVGYMFEISAISNVEILTFELDIRFDLNPTDLSIEVYTYNGAFDIVVDEPEAWDQLAGTYLVPTLSGSALIPASDFTPVHIAAGDKRSFYVTMKYPYLDHTVYGLQHTGDIHISGDDMQLLVGSGFHSYKFPGVIDQTLNPQFAGIVHYQKSFGCDDSKASTTLVDFKFLFEVSALDEALVSQTNAAIDVAVSNLLASNGKLKSLVTEFGLQKGLPAQSYLVSHKSACPEAWVECPTSFLNTRVTFHHKDALDSGTLRYEMYKLTSTIHDAVIASPATNAQVLYLGYQSTEAKYTLRLQGVPSTAMDDIQTKYFEDTTELFLQNSPDGTPVFRWHVDQQTLSGNRRDLRRRLDGGSTLELQGIVQGAFFSGRTPNDVSTAIQKLFESQETTYRKLLGSGDIRPGDVHHDVTRLAYFQNITKVSSVVEFPAPSAPSGPKKTTVAAVVFGSLGGLLFFVGFGLLYRHRRNEKVRSIELEEYRKEMRDLRRSARIEKSKSTLTKSFCASELSRQDTKQNLSSAESMNLSTSEMTARPITASLSKVDIANSSLRKSDPNTGVHTELYGSSPTLRTRSKSEENADVPRHASVRLPSRGGLPRNEKIELDEKTQRLSTRQLVSALSSPNLGRKSSYDASSGPLRASFPLPPRSPTSTRQTLSSGSEEIPSTRRDASSDSPTVMTRQLVTAASSPCLGATENGSSRARVRHEIRSSLPTLLSHDESPGNRQRSGSRGTLSPKSPSRCLINSTNSSRLGNSPKAATGCHGSSSPKSPRDARRADRPLRASFPLSPQLDASLSPDSTSHRRAAAIGLTTSGTNASPRSCTQRESPRTRLNSLTSGSAGAMSPGTPMRRLVTVASSPNLSAGPRATGKSIGPSSPASLSDNRRVSVPLRAPFQMYPQSDAGQMSPKAINPRAASMGSTAVKTNSSSRSPSGESPQIRQNSQMSGSPRVTSPKASVRRLLTAASSPCLGTGPKPTGRSIGPISPHSLDDRPRVSRPHPTTFPLSPPLEVCTPKAEIGESHRPTKLTTNLSEKPSVSARPIVSKCPASPNDELRDSRRTLSTFPVSPPLDTGDMVPKPSQSRPGKISGLGEHPSSRSHPASDEPPSPDEPSSPKTRRNSQSSGSAGTVSPRAPSRLLATAVSSPCLGSGSKIYDDMTGKRCLNSPSSPTDKLRGYIPYRSSLPAAVPLGSGLSPELSRQQLGNGKSLSRSNERLLPSPPFPSSTHAK